MRSWLGKRPEFLAIVLSVFAWAWMVREAFAGRQWSCCESLVTPMDEARGWLLMVMAMMLPFTLQSLRRISQRSYRFRRLRAVVAYLAGYVGTWMLPLAIVVPMSLLPFGHEFLLATALCLLAAVWTYHPMRRRLFLRCHREIPLHPLGWQADYDALRQGGIQAIPCIGGCLPLMLACTVTHHHMVMMAGGMLLAGMERRMFRFRSAPLAIGALGLAGWSLLLG